MYMQKSIVAVIVAGGLSARMGFDKMYYKINGHEILWHSVKAFDNHIWIDSLVVVVSEPNLQRAQALLSDIKKPLTIVVGGKNRASSVKNGVVAANADYVAIHDAARPYISQGVISDTIILAHKTGAAAPAVAVKDTIKLTNGNYEVLETLPRAKLSAVQTPQVFLKQNYIKALQQTLNAEITDDCMLMENAGFKVMLCAGDYTNIKITTREDLPKMNNETPALRIGHGYDVHKLVEGRQLIMGGVNIPYCKGLLGHSDADVLLHAIADAMLGAAAMGDIGKHFPDTDEKYKNADSLQLLSKVYQLLQNNGFSVVNIDATVLCQAPKLSPFIDNMRQNIAKAVNVATSAVSVKATTEEGLGFTGQGMGIAAHAVVLLC